MEQVGDCTIARLGIQPDSVVEIIPRGSTIRVPVSPLSNDPNFVLAVQPPVFQPAGQPEGDTEVPTEVSDFQEESEDYTQFMVNTHLYIIEFEEDHFDVKSAE